MLSLHFVKEGRYFDAGNFRFVLSKYLPVLSKTKAVSGDKDTGLPKFLINSLKLSSLKISLCRKAGPSKLCSS